MSRDTYSVCTSIIYTHSIINWELPPTIYRVTPTSSGTSFTTATYRYAM